MIVSFEIEGWSDPVRVSVRPHSIAVSLGTEPIYIFDPAGRLHEAFIAGRNYLRGLDGRVLEKWGRSQIGVPIRRDLPPNEAARLVEQTILAMDQVQSAVSAGKVRWVEGMPTEAEWDAARRALETIAAWDASRLAADAAEFDRIYWPVSILPPDQYLALVLQLTEGCSYNECTFCTFYRDRPFRIKQLPEFVEHVARVKHFFGPALRMRRTIFLADANAIVAPQRLLVPALDLVQREFEVIPNGANLTAYRRDHPAAFDGVYAFADAFTGHFKSTADYRELAERSLRRVYIGLESGHDPLLHWVRKAGTSADAVEVVRTIKAAGVRVGVIIMIGIGGRRFAAGHVADTIRAVNAMGLGAGDFVYFSEFVEPPDSEYTTQAAADGVERLTPTEMHAQMKAIRAGFRFASPPPKVSIYDIRESIY
jgi:hypothetical protein